MVYRLTSQMRLRFLRMRPPEQQKGQTPERVKSYRGSAAEENGKSRDATLRFGTGHDH